MKTIKNKYLEKKMFKGIFTLSKILLFASIVLFLYAASSLPVLAQNGSVGIGDDTDDQSESAILYLNSIDKGFLAPRITLDDASTAAPITGPATGLLIYNIDGAEPHGYYYWDGTVWVKFSPPLPALTAGAGMVSNTYDGSAAETFVLDFTPSGVGFNGTTTTVARGDHQHDPADANLENLSPGGLISGNPYDGTNPETWTVTLFDLTAGDGLTGGPYDGTTPVEFDVSLSDHTAGDGFTAGSGVYDGLSPIEWDLDFLVANAINGNTTNPARSNHTHNPGDVNLEELSAGDGLTGGPYDGTTPVEFDVSLSDHTAGDGFTAGSGVYDGLSPIEWDLDFLTANAINGTTTNPSRSDHTHSGMLTGAGTTNQVAFWNPDNVLDGDANFTWDGTDLNLTGNENITGNLDLTGSFAINNASNVANVFSTSPTQIGADVNYTLPNTAGTANQILSTNGSGVLSWITFTAPSDGDWTINGNNIFSAVSGNVGIGTSSPGAKLDVNGVSSFTGNMTLANLGTASELRFAEPNASGSEFTSLKAQAQSNNIFYTLPSTAGTTGQVLTTDNSGNLSWSEGGNAWLLNGNFGTDPSIHFIGTIDEKDFTIRTFNQERIKILRDGKVGIGTNSPAVQFEVNGAASFSDDVTVTNGNIAIKNNTSTAGTLSFMEPSADGNGDITTFSAADDQDGDINYTLPAEQGASSSVSYLKNDGDGNLEWTTNIAISGLLIFQEPVSVPVTVDNQQINTNISSYIALLPDETPGNRTITLTDGTRASQLLVISVVATGNNGVELDNPNGDNLMLSTPNGYNLTNAHTALLVWNGTHWIELSKSANQD